MLVTLVAVICSGPMCLEKVVTDSDHTDMSFTSCALVSQAGLADWLEHGPYAGWKLQSYRCVLGPYTPRRGA